MPKSISNNKSEKFNLKKFIEINIFKYIFRNKLDTFKYKKSLYKLPNSNIKKCIFRSKYILGSKNANQAMFI